MQIYNHISYYIDSIDLFSILEFLYLLSKTDVLTKNFDLLNIIFSKLNNNLYSIQV